MANGGRILDSVPVIRLHRSAMARLGLVFPHIQTVATVIDRVREFGDIWLPGVSWSGPPPERGGGVSIRWASADGAREAIVMVSAAGAVEAESWSIECGSAPMAWPPENATPGPRPPDPWPHDVASVPQDPWVMAASFAADARLPCDHATDVAHCDHATCSSARELLERREYIVWSSEVRHRCSGVSGAEAPARPG